MANRGELSWISSEAARRAKSALAVALSFAILLGGMGFVSWKGYGMYMAWRQKDDWIGEGDQPVQIVIESGSGWGVVADSLVAANVIKDPNLFTKEALKLADGPKQPGTYNLLTHLPAKTAADWLNDPKRLVTTTFTIPEGLRLVDMYQILIDDAGVTQEDIDKALEAIKADPTVIGLNPAAGNNLEGFLFPDTYVVHPPIDSDALSIFKQMAGEFNTLAESLGLEARAQALGYSTHDIVTIASLIEAEVNTPQYAPMVARAIYNRLAAGIPLQVESAFRYGRLMTDGIPYNDPITSASQNDASLPYNIYINPGLPATPIDGPGKAALEAALNPADGDWLYWVTVNLDTGETKFTASESEFWDFVAEFDSWCVANGNPAGCS